MAGAVLVLVMSLLVTPLTAAAQSSSAVPNDVAETAAVTAALQRILSAGAPPVPDIVAALGTEPLDGLGKFYAQRRNAPLWVSDTGPMPEAGFVLDRTPEALPASLRPLLTAAATRRHATDPGALAELDLLTSAIYGAAAVGPQDPTATQGAGRALFQLDGAADRLTLLRDALPVDPGFWRLRDAFSAYRALAAAGGWGSVPDGPKLDLGAAGPRVDALRRRLAATGDLASAAPTTSAYDDVLRQAVQHFQARHGLETDGVTGEKTLAALNVPVERRLGVMAANLIRLQRQHRNWGQRYIAVNIAAAAYRLVVDGRVVFERPAVVGKPSWPTPMLDSVIDRVEFHPYWRIPMNIAEQEVWPKQDADPGYFARQGIHAVNSQLIQDPGPANPLGIVKFLFDNPYSVYLHDTTAPGLFARAYRFSSHGCIRVSDAGDLARQLLASDPQWPAERVDAALQTGGNQGVTLREPIPVHIVYDTAWADDNGMVEFRADVYHRDVVPAVAPAPIAPDTAAPGAPGPLADATPLAGCNS
ncbi:L,D-transpeptidase family protein [Dongia sedimenti]|uniref:L,D-transpeptidase family protein n=1 Tax=Dongia sedimenti TaxID=3064282 RepID=A0ABU0YSM3_9PROT|nr:L,D-transpeptidase family protein [Rhodospirillaceae bacterium R-7]